MRKIRTDNKASNLKWTGHFAGSEMTTLSPAKKKNDYIIRVLEPSDRLWEPPTRLLNRVFNGFSSFVVFPFSFILYFFIFQKISGNSNSLFYFTKKKKYF